MGTLFIVSAPSGAGKTTLVNEMVARLGVRYAIERVITYTSKNARVGEQNGRDYHFISPYEFEQRIEKGFFLEYSTAYGTYYGSPRSILDEIQKGKSCLMILDRIGAQKVIRQVPNAVLIWVYTQGILALENRLKKRATENTEQMCKRLEQAQIEIAQERKEQLYQYHVLNDDFDKAATQLEAIVVDEINRGGLGVDRLI